MFDERTQIYNVRVDPAHQNSPYAKFIRMIGTGKRVLEVGCATGYFSDYLVRHLGCEVVGIELSAEGAKQAAEYCSQVIVGDVEKDALDVVRGSFDIITFGDVLEHLVCPGAVLARCKRLLADGGYVLISIPNVAHYSMRFALLCGRFPYETYGLLDRTHLRFFTLATARQMLLGAGLEIRAFDLVYSFRGMRLVHPGGRLERFLKNHFTELVGYQFIFKAAPRVGAQEAAVSEDGSERRGPEDCLRAV